MCIRDRIEPACPSGGPAVVVTPHAHRRRGNRYSTRRRTISTSHVCDQPAPASTAPPRPAPHPRHCVGGATGSTLSGSSSRVRPWPSWPGCPPRSRSGDRSRDETSLSRARRCALRAALAWIDSFDDGVPESSLPIPNRRSNSAIRNPCPATIVRSSAFSVSFADRNAAISASLAATTSRSRALARRSRSTSDTSGTSDMTRDHRHWPAEIKHPTRRRVAQPPQVGTTPEWTRPHLGRLAPTYHPRHTRSHLLGRHGTHSQKRGRQRTGQPHQQEDRTDQPAEPETTGLAIHRRLVALTLAEIRRLLNLIHHGEHAVARGLEWSTWRRWHQAQARRAHVRRHLHLQTLMI